MINLVQELLFSVPSRECYVFVLRGFLWPIPLIVEPVQNHILEMHQGMRSHMFSFWNAFIAFSREPFLVFKTVL